jgi:hypothetical protein
MKTSAVTNWDLLNAAFKMPAGGPEHYVLLRLIGHRNSKTGLCCPSYSRLMKETGFGKTKLGECLQALQKAGFISWERGWRNKDSGGIPNRYTFHLEAMVASPDSGLSTDEQHVRNQSYQVRNPEQHVRNQGQQVRPAVPNHRSTEPVKNRTIEVIEPSARENLEGSVSSLDRQNGFNTQEAACPPSGPSKTLADMEVGWRALPSGPEKYRAMKQWQSLGGKLPEVAA